MLEELNRYENLGTPKFFIELFGQLNTATTPWTRINVQTYFYNRIVDGDYVFDGCLPLAEAIGAIQINEDGIITISAPVIRSLVSEKYLSNKLLEMIVVATKED